MSRFTSSSSANWPRVWATAAYFSGFFVCGIFIFLGWEAVPFLTQADLVEFLFSESWYPLEGKFGAGAMISASVTIAAGAVLFAAPIGMSSAAYIALYSRPWERRLSLRLIELLAGIPSVVFGLWGLHRLIPWLNHHGVAGSSLISAILVLSLMILPTVTLLSFQAFHRMPDELVKGAQALGLRFSSSLVKLYIPAVWEGLRSAILLSFARAIGETMAVVMVSGNVVQFPSELFAPVRTLTANLALEMAYATDLHRSALFACGWILVVLVGVIMMLSRETPLEQRRL